MAYFFIHDPQIIIYNDEVNIVPASAQPLSDALHLLLFEGQSTGQPIIWNKITQQLDLGPKPNTTVLTTRKLTTLQFLALFTDEEKNNIMELARTNNQAMLWLTMVAGAAYIDLDDPLTEKGLEYLVDLSVITANRLGEIINYVGAPI